MSYSDKKGSVHIIFLAVARDSGLSPFSFFAFPLSEICFSDNGIGTSVIIELIDEFLDILMGDGKELHSLEIGDDLMLEHGLKVSKHFGFSSVFL